jgi:uncharacterized protein
VESLAVEWGLRWRAVRTAELRRPGYVANAGDRCYHCRSELFDVLAPIAAAEGAVMAVGTIVDDLADHRPGQRAAAERGVHTPLVDAGFTKADVRAAARDLGLATWDKPAAPCLASRIPHHSEVSPEKLAQVEAAEAGLRRLGLGDLRVRHHGDVARLEVAVEDLPALVSDPLREQAIEVVRAAGFRFLAVDLAGIQSGAFTLPLVGVREG